MPSSVRNASKLTGISLEYTGVSTDSYGLYISQGNGNNPSFPLYVYNSSAAAPAFVVNSNGGVTAGNPTGGIQGTGTVNTSGGFYIQGTPVVKSTANSTVELGGGYGGTLGTVILGVANGTLPAAGSTFNGLIVFDTTNNRFCFYVGGNRYFVAGTSF
jgi:hypothetical protein